MLNTQKVLAFRQAHLAKLSEVRSSLEKQAAEFKKIYENSLELPANRMNINEYAKLSDLRHLIGSHLDWLDKEFEKVKALDMVWN